uniref:Cathelicidin antimicrobial peptide n=1 Tax=Jaculus jaculus TaxID=51337 RepID=A0A8C5P3C0_JACJA
MQTPRNGSSSGLWSLLWLLLGLVMPPAIVAQTLSYRQAVLRAVDGFNQRSLDTNLYRLLDLDSQPQGNEDPDNPVPVDFTVKETVCHKATQQSPEQCDFKADGLVKRCVGTVTVNPARDSFDINCNGLHQPLKKVVHLVELLKKGGRKIGENLKKIGQRLQNFFQKFELHAEK